VLAFGRLDSIENHYHRAKRFGSRAPTDWREAKELKDSGRRQTGWQIGPLTVDVRSNPQGNSFQLDDLGIQFYVMLWYRYLLRNRHLLAVAAEFDEFEDPFRGAFPFCQADVIRKATREGLNSLRPMFARVGTAPRRGRRQRGGGRARAPHRLRLRPALVEDGDAFPSTGPTRMRTALRHAGPRRPPVGTNLTIVH
jgi:hypothetical protein